MLVVLYTTRSMAQNPIFSYTRLSESYRGAHTRQPDVFDSYVFWKKRPNVVRSINEVEPDAPMAEPDSLLLEQDTSETTLVVAPDDQDADAGQLSAVTYLNTYLYNQPAFAPLTSFAVQGPGTGTYINAEIGSFLFGPVRLSVGGSFQTTGDTTKDEAVKSSLQKIISAGGSVNFNFSVPLIFKLGENSMYNFGVFAHTIWGINPNVEDSTGKTLFTSNDLKFSNQTGIRIYYDVGSNDGKARLSFDISYDYAWGNSFYELNLADFSIIKLRTGVIISDLVSIYVSGPLYSSSEKVQATPFTMSVQFSPQELSERLK